MHKNKKFGFLLFNQFEDLDFFGPWEMIALWSQQFDGPELVLVSETGGEITSAKGLVLKTTTNFSNCPLLDFLLIPGGQGTRREVDNEALINFVKERAPQSHSLLSVCTGAFILQKANLLKNKEATTHWASLERLKAFPEVIVAPKRYTVTGNLWTSAGVSAGIDMILAFIAHIAGEEVAGDIQRWTEYYPNHKIYTKTNLPKYMNPTLEN